MSLEELPIHDDVRTGRAEVGGGPVYRPAASEQLHLDGNRKLLVLRHALRRLTVKHQATVANGPAGTAGDLLSHEAILGTQPVVRKLVLVKDVPELAVELLVLVVGHLQDAVLDPEGVADIVPQFMSGDLDLPALQVLPVEELYPLVLGACWAHGQEENATRCDDSSAIHDRSSDSWFTVRWFDLSVVGDR